MNAASYLLTLLDQQSSGLVLGFFFHIWTVLLLFFMSETFPFLALLA